LFQADFLDKKFVEYPFEVRCFQFRFLMRTSQLTGVRIVLIINSSSFISCQGLLMAEELEERGSWACLQLRLRHARIATD
jgi:hypothetical protein